jgi:curli production assembly/transport component CsgF
MRFRFATFAIVATAWMSGASASELTYQPINPSFGGNPFNSAHLLALAEAQNKYIDEPRFSAGMTGLSQSELFVRQLQSRLLSGLASQVSDAIFGDAAQDSGEIVFGDQRSHSSAVSSSSTSRSSMPRPAARPTSGCLCSRPVRPGEHR